MRTASKPPGKAMYVAPRADWLWLRSEQRKLYTRSKERPDDAFRKLWGLITDLRNLRVATALVARNKGRQTPGIDGVTVGKVVQRGVEPFVANARAELRSGAYRPSPVRRVLIPKRGQPGKFRPLGIPTVKDRVIQAAMKNILEPIFEPGFFPVSYGFRPGKSVHGALEHLRILLRPTLVSGNQRLPYQWAIEGDIKGCFDNIDHHRLMVRVRRRVTEGKMTRLIVAFLKAGILSEEQFLRNDTGVPQGGILSPLLANIALSAIEERYERHVRPRARGPSVTSSPESRAKSIRNRDRRSGQPIVFPIRYADDFILLVAAPLGEPDAHARDLAIEEKNRLATFLKEHLGLELSEGKTLITPVTSPMPFLGHHVRVRRHPDHHRWVSTSVIPKDRSQRFRRRIKEHFGRHRVYCSLGEQLRELNPVLRGWCHFYRHAWGAKKVFAALDSYLWWTILRWLRKKHRGASFSSLRARYGLTYPGGRAVYWQENATTAFRMSSVTVEPYRLAWEDPPAYASHHGEPGA